MIIVATIIYCLQRLNVQIPSIINNYLNDLLCIPIILSISQFFVQKIKRDTKYVLKKNIIFFVVVYYSIYFEYYLPKITIRYTADILDVIMYCIGGYIFYMIEYGLHNRIRILFKAFLCRHLMVLKRCLADLR